MDIAGLSKTQQLWAIDLAPARVEQPAATHDLISAVQAANQMQLLGEGSQLAFRYDRETQRQVIEVRDKVTNEVVRQIPPENLMRVMYSLLRQDREESLE